MGEATKTKESASRIDINSKFMKTLLIILTGFLIFVGPTYAPYAMIHALKLSFVRSMAAGAVLFVIGLFLLWFLIRKKILS
jgi:uncharacterized protein YjeT (DUF2065 family)